MTNNDIKEIKVKKLSKDDLKDDLINLKNEIALNNKDNAIIKYFNIYNNNNTYLDHKVIKCNKSAILEIKNILSDILDKDDLNTLKKDINSNNSYTLFKLYDQAIKSNKDLFIINNINCTKKEYNDKTYKK